MHESICIPVKTRIQESWIPDHVGHARRDLKREYSKAPIYSRSLEQRSQSKKQFYIPTPLNNKVAPCVIAS